MPDRASFGPRTGRAPVAELHLVCCSVHSGQLVILMREPNAGRAAIPTQILEAGEDPERLEEEMGDLMGEDGMPEDGPGEATGESKIKARLRRLNRQPQRDPMLYEMSEFVK